MSGVSDGARMDEAVVHVALRLEQSEERRLGERLRAHGFEHRSWKRPEELVRGLADCVWLLIGRPPRMDWSGATSLRLLQVAGSGVDPLFPANGLPERVWIANTRGVQADAVRDHAVALLLALARRIPGAVTRQLGREWTREPVAPLAGKTLAVLGLGAVGSRVVASAASFGLRVRALRRTEKPASSVDNVSTRDGLLEVLHGADFVVVCLPLTQSTRRLVDAAALSVLAPGACLVDVSRGGVVDHGAVEAALRAGRLGAAALDVFDDEPLPKDSTLWTCPRLLVTPHVAGFTPDYLDRTVEVFLENIARIRRGEPPLGAVSRADEY
jgi:phosphoglycerate dehydrogenase-like enzyme